MMSELEKHLNVKFPQDLSSHDSKIFIDDLCKKHKVECTEPRSVSRLIDKLVEAFIEKDLVNPTFIMNHP